MVAKALKSNKEKKIREKPMKKIKSFKNTAPDWKNNLQKCRFCDMVD